MLGIYILIFSVGLFERYLQNNLHGTTGEVVGNFLGFSNFLYGPLLYCFVDILTSNKPQLTRKHFYHTLPFIIGFLASAFSIITSNSKNNRFDDIVEFILFETLVVQILTYNILAIKKLKKHRASLLQTYSTLEEKDLNWLRFYLVFITGTYILSFLITHLVVFGLRVDGLYVLVQLAITLSIYLMSYRIIFQPGLFTLTPSVQTEIVEETTTETNKYQRSGLKTEQAVNYLNELLVYMDTAKPYLDQELTIYALAEQLNITRNHLTQIINEQLGKNFYEFVNGYRVEEVKRMMEDSQYDNLTISALGLEAGFKSKTAFNTNFKKITGYTPTEWKKNQQLPGELPSAEVPA
jgi:AraC-like DNA-binding protein